MKSQFTTYKLSDTQTRWSTIEKEAFAIKWALEKLNHYLHNAKFVIKTDHKPLKYILNSPLNNGYEYYGIQLYR